MNLPNKITVFRIFLAPVWLAVFLLDIPYRWLVSACVFALAAATDAIDGRIARKNNIVTVFGKFLDLRRHFDVGFSFRASRFFERGALQHMDCVHNPRQGVYHHFIKADCVVSGRCHTCKHFWQDKNGYADGVVYSCYAFVRFRGVYRL